MLNNILLQYSQNESKLFGIKVARGVFQQIEAHSLQADIFENNYDLVRITIPAHIEDAQIELYKTGFQYYFSGGITRYSTSISKIKNNTYIHNDIVYEQYNEANTHLLNAMLKDTWGNYPLGYYKTPIIGNVISKEMEIKAVYEYYKKNNLNCINPNNKIMFMKHGDNYIGFFALNIIGNRLESHIGGILSTFRNTGYFIDMQEYIRRYCLENGLTHFDFGARNENYRVNKIFLDYGYTPSHIEYVYHILGDKFKNLNLI